MKLITEFLKCFTSITTGILIIFLIVNKIQQTETIQLNSLLHILIASFIGTILSVLTLYNPDNSAKHVYLLILLHYLLMWGAMSLMGILFGWIPASVKGVLMMAVYVIIVYIFVVVVYYVSAKRESKVLNKALKYRNKQK